MRGFREAMKSVSTTWAAFDFSGLRRALRIAVTAIITAAVVGLASFVAVAIGLT
jgi:hypothetical protein